MSIDITETNTAKVKMAVSLKQSISDGKLNSLCICLRLDLIDCLDMNQPAVDKFVQFKVFTILISLCVLKEV